MGLFHCPLGAVGFGDEGCIRCGLCSAATAERKKAAAEILRAWIREHGSSRKDIKIQKIAICGKGGAGKSTATALLSGALAALGSLSYHRHRQLQWWAVAQIGTFCAALAAALRR